MEVTVWQLEDLPPALQRTKPQLRADRSRGQHLLAAQRRSAESVLDTFNVQLPRLANFALPQLTAVFQQGAWLLGKTLSRPA